MSTPQINPYPSHILNSTKQQQQKANYFQLLSGVNTDMTWLQWGPVGSSGFQLACDNGFSQKDLDDTGMTHVKIEDCWLTT